MSKGRVLLAITLAMVLLTGVSGIGLADFDPDRQADSLSYDELVEKLGPVPTDELPTDIRIGACLKNLANQFWQQLAEGYKNVAAEYGVRVDIQAARTETELQEQLSILETMLLNNYAAYLLSPLSNDNLNRVVYELKADRIPVINVTGVHCRCRRLLEPGSGHRITASLLEKGSMGWARSLSRHSWLKRRSKERPVRQP